MPTPTPAESTTPDPDQAFRVVVAEDDAAFRSLLSDWLATMGAEVIEVADGLMLIEQLERYARSSPTSRPFDLVVSDHRMPGAAGAAALRVGRRQGVDVPAVVISAFPDDELVASVEQDGIEVLSKPLSVRQFRETVERVRTAWQVSASVG